MTQLSLIPGVEPSPAPSSNGRGRCSAPAYLLFRLTDKIVRRILTGYYVRRLPTRKEKDSV